MDHAPLPLDPATAKTAKAQLREELRALRISLPQSSLSALSLQLTQALAHWLRARGTKQVLLFYPVLGEVDLRPLAELLPEVALALPVLAVRGRTMHFAAWRRDQPMVVNRYGIPEPQVDPGVPPLIVAADAVALVPCLALDYTGTRIGYGGGFYDRFLVKHPLTTVGVLLAEFMHLQIPREAHDISLNYAATEEGVLPLPHLRVDDRP